MNAEPPGIDKPAKCVGVTQFVCKNLGVCVPDCMHVCVHAVLLIC